MKIRRIFFALIIIGIILILFLLYYFREGNFTHKSIYELNWDINIPSDLKMIYHDQDKHDFQGKGKRYTILESHGSYEGPLIISKGSKKELQSYSGSSKDETKHDVEEFINTIATDLNVPENKLPEFDRYYVWQKFVMRENVLIVLYYPNDYKIYFIEKLF